MADITSVIKASEISDKTLQGLAADPNVNLSQAGASAIREAVVNETAEVIMNQTNQEPWYLSRVTWGAILAAVAGLAGIFGYSFSAEDQQYWMDNIDQMVQLASSVVALVGGTLAWYGRWRAKKAIGQ